MLGFASLQRFTTALKRYANQPLAFEANQGQTDRRVRFLARNQGYNLFVTDHETVLQCQPTKLSARHKKAGETAAQTPATFSERSPTTLRFKLLNANPAPEVRGLEPLPNKANYFRGKDQNQWRTGITQYAKVEEKDVYPGINLLWYGKQQHLEYDFVLQPHTNPKTIQLELTGWTGLVQMADGSAFPVNLVNLVNPIYADLFSPLA